MTLIAGHFFQETPTGRRCTCGKSWLDLVSVRDQWELDAEGVAHSGRLTVSELDQLLAEEDRIWSAVQAVSSFRELGYENSRHDFL